MKKKLYLKALLSSTILISSFEGHAMWRAVDQKIDQFENSVVKGWTRLWNGKSSNNLSHTKALPTVTQVNGQDSGKSSNTEAPVQVQEVSDKDSKEQLATGPQAPVQEEKVQKLKVLNTPDTRRVIEAAIDLTKVKSETDSFASNLHASKLSISDLGFIGGTINASSFGQNVLNSLRESMAPRVTVTISSNTSTDATKSHLLADVPVTSELPEENTSTDNKKEAALSASEAPLSPPAVEAKKSKNVPTILGDIINFDLQKLRKVARPEEQKSKNSEGLTNVFSDAIDKMIKPEEVSQTNLETSLVNSEVAREWGDSSRNSHLQPQVSPLKPEITSAPIEPVSEATLRMNEVKRLNQVKEKYEKLFKGLEFQYKTEVAEQDKNFILYTYIVEAVAYQNDPKHPEGDIINRYINAIEKLDKNFTENLIDNIKSEFRAKVIEFAKVFPKIAEPEKTVEDLKKILEKDYYYGKELHDKSQALDVNKKLVNRRKAIEDSDLRESDNGFGVASDITEKSKKEESSPVATVVEVVSRDTPVEDPKISPEQKERAKAILEQHFVNQKLVNQKNDLKEVAKEEVEGKREAQDEVKAELTEDFGESVTANLGTEETSIEPDVQPMNESAYGNSLNALSPAPIETPPVLKTSQSNVSNFTDSTLEAAKNKLPVESEKKGDDIVESDGVPGVPSTFTDSMRDSAIQRVIDEASKTSLPLVNHAETAIEADASREYEPILIPGLPCVLEAIGSSKETSVTHAAPVANEGLLLNGATESKLTDKTYLQELKKIIDSTSEDENTESEIEKRAEEAEQREIERQQRSAREAEQREIARQQQLEEDARKREEARLKMDQEAEQREIERQQRSAREAEQREIVRQAQLDQAEAQRQKEVAESARKIEQAKNAALEAMELNNQAENIKAIKAQKFLRQQEDKAAEHDAKRQKEAEENAKRLEDLKEKQAQSIKDEAIRQETARRKSFEQAKQEGLKSKAEQDKRVEEAAKQLEIEQDRHAQAMKDEAERQAALIRQNLAKAKEVSVGKEEDAEKSEVDVELKKTDLAPAADIDWGVFGEEVTDVFSEPSKKAAPVGVPGVPAPGVPAAAAPVVAPAGAPVAAPGVPAAAPAGAPAPAPAAPHYAPAASAPSAATSTTTAAAPKMDVQQEAVARGVTYSTEIVRQALDATIFEVSSRQNDFILAVGENFAALQKSQTGAASGDGFVQNVNIWFKGFASHGKGKASYTVKSYKVNKTGGIIGIDSLINDRNLLGISYSFTDSLQKVNSQVAYKNKAKSHIFNGYWSCYFANNIFLNSQVKLGWAHFKNNGGSKMKTKGTLAGIREEIGYEIVTNNATLIPSIGISYDEIKINKFKDKGQNKELDVSGTKVKRAAGLAGLNILKVFEVDNYKITPNISLGIEHDLTSKVNLVKVTDVNNSDNNATVSPGKSGKNTYIAGAGVTVASNSNIEVGMNYSFLKRKAFHSHTGAIKLKLKF